MLLALCPVPVPNEIAAKREASVVLMMVLLCTEISDGTWVGPAPEGRELGWSGCCEEWPDRLDREISRVASLIENSAWAELLTNPKTGTLSGAEMN